MDEIRNDQEVAGEPHALNNAKFEIEALLVFCDRGGMWDNGQTILKALVRLAAKFVDLVFGEFGQNWIAFVGFKRTAFRDLNGVVDCFWQIGKQFHHFIGRLEIMFGGQAAAALLLINICAFGNTQQCIMRRIHFAVGKIDIIGGNQRQVHGVGHFNKMLFGCRLCTRVFFTI